MEVHPPDHAIHSWRDFFIHIATIVVGLLIAIGLEQSVEWVHHRHLLQQAREQIHDEMAENRKTLAADLRALNNAAAASRSNIVLLGEPASNRQMSFGWQWDSPGAAAWNTARETGALALMPYEEAQSLASIYNQQELLQTEATQHIHRYTQSLGPVLRHGELQAVPVDRLSLEERTQLIQSYATNLAEIAVLRDLLINLDHNYAGSGGIR